jgi:transcriptional regulator with XRE-family HTH domain
MEFFKTFRKQFNLTQDELAQKLSIDRQTVAFYEADRAKPSFKILQKAAEVYEVSFDFFILGNDSSYPRNLRLLNLAKKLDSVFHSEGRSTIESSAKSLMGNNFIPDTPLNQDSIEIELVKDFHQNLKNIRNYKKMTQPVLAMNLGISRNLLAQYELKIFPPVERLIKLSKLLNISIHGLATGQKLSFDFQDRIFGQTMLLADHFLSLDDQKVLIRLMESSLNYKNLISA